nr:hypothetical protein [Candidatus Sigynarchaeum springense]
MVVDALLGLVAGVEARGRNGPRDVVLARGACLGNPGDVEVILRRCAWMFAMVLTALLMKTWVFKRRHFSNVARLGPGTAWHGLARGLEQGLAARCMAIWRRRAAAVQEAKIPIASCKRKNPCRRSSTLAGKR